ncbi:MAG TPA: SOS response-associated peptidase [Polyangia bacterium]
MCGRASLTTPDWETIRALLDAVPDDDEREAYSPRYNVAPTQLHPILRIVGGERRLQRASWGLPPIENRALINARIETIQSRPMWQDALAERRCVVPVDGFFEWQGDQPYWFHRADGGLLLLAGLWEPGTERARFVVVTCAPNKLVAEAHDRMPAILAPSCVVDWLARPAVDVIAPAPEDALVATPVSTRVNSPANDDARLLEPVRPRTQLSLF